MSEKKGGHAKKMSMSDIGAQLAANNDDGDWQEVPFSSFSSEKRFLNTAQASKEVMKDFYQSNEYKKLRQKHKRKESSRKSVDIASSPRGLVSQQYGVRGILKHPSKLKPIISTSSSLSSLQHTGDIVDTASVPPRSVYSRLGKKTSFEDDLSSTPGLGIGGEVHKPPINIDDFHSVNNVMHRVSFVSGSQPGKDIRRVQTPADNIERSENFASIQLKSMHSNETIQDVVQQVITLHKELSEEAHTIGVHRKELGARVDSINKQILKLFERVMSELLAMQRNKFVSMADELEKLRDAAEELLDKFLNEKSRREYLERQMKEYEDKNEQLSYMLQMKENELKTLRAQIESLEKEIRDHFDYLEQLRKEKENWELERLELEKRLKAEEKALLDKLLDEARNQMKREFEILLEKERNESERLKERLDEMTKLYREANSKLTKLMPNISKKRNAGQQTEVDECGLWDKQDGWLMPLSKTRLIRKRWRDAIDFARCPSCKGSGKFVANVAALLRRMARGQTDAFEKSVVQNNDEDKKSQRLKRKRKNLPKWTIPDDLVQFLVNLPRSIQAKRHHGIPWILKRCWKLLELKWEADNEDNQLGYALQSFVDFLIESHLERSKLRTGAELNIYMLISSLHEVYRYHPMLHTFSRFLALLDDSDVKVGSIGDDKAERDGGDNQHHHISYDDIGRSFTSYYGPLTLPVLTVYLFARQCLLRDNYDGRYAVAIRNIKTSNTNKKMRDKVRKMNEEEKLKHIDNCLHSAEQEIVGGWWLSEEAVVVNLSNEASIDDHDVDKEVLGQLKHDHADHIGDVHPSPALSPNQKVFVESSQPSSPKNSNTNDAGTTTGENTHVDSMPVHHDWGITLPKHVCVADKDNGKDSYHFWIPLDRAVQVLVSMLSFLDEDESIEVLRIVEKDAMFLSSHGKFVPPDAMHSAIRFAMRQFIKIYSGFREGQTDFELSPEDKLTLMGVEGSKDADIIVMVNLDKVLCVLVQVVQTRISYVEESLANAFTEGDENGDGVLSFQEFLNIVTKVAPHYPRRRILKMFREALQIGDGDSIDRTAFVTVCKRHDLIQLVDLVKLAEGPLASLVGAAGKKMNKKTSPSNEDEVEKRKKIATNAPQVRGLRNKIKALNAFANGNLVANDYKEVKQEEQPVTNRSPTRLQFMMQALQAQTKTDEQNAKGAEQGNEQNLDIGLSRFLGNRINFRPQQKKYHLQQQELLQKEREAIEIDDEIGDEDVPVHHSPKIFTRGPLFSNPTNFDCADVTRAQADREVNTTMNSKDSDVSAAHKQSTPSSLLSAARGILGTTGK